MGAARTYRTTAVVLSKTKLKETDLILTLLDESGCQVRAVAKGARKPGSRTAARCEVFCTVDLLLARGRSLDVVSQVELVSAPLGPAPSLEALTAASAIADIARLCSFEDARDPFVHAITRSALAHVGACGADAPHLDVITAAYVFKLLSHVGYRPVLDACAACGDPAPTRFSAAAGGLVCASCATTIAGSKPLEPGMADWLRSLIGLTFDELAAAPVDAFRASLLLAHAHVWAATHLDCRLRSLEFMLGR